ncbi:MAG TPA: HAD-IA family hydrolase [Bryobacteraceae bacterium]|nr:HAD-IA family hydrolase [Bryobacteraceae bacterium]
MKKLLIFDLDGTLIDSKLDLAHAVNATREHLHMPPLDHELIATYVGHGAPVLIRRVLGPSASEAEVETALKYFIAWYTDHKLDNTCLYPGVGEGLRELDQAGVQMAVLTNKPVGASRGILDGLGVSGLFFRVYGGNSFDQKKPHPIGAETIMAEAAIGPEDTAMVGDSSVDVQTARNAGISAYGVTWGFQPETFGDAPPDATFANMHDLARFVLNGRES